MENRIFDKIGVLQNISGAINEDGPLTKILRDGVQGNPRSRYIKGPLYVIEEALEIEAAHPKEVKKFNVHPLVETREGLESILGKKSFDRLINCETKIRFDIQTSDKLIDCKNIQWVNVSNTEFLEDWVFKRALENFEQIYRHKVVAEILGMKYEFRSKHKMPVTLKNYLEQKGIEYIERTCGKCASCLNN